MRKSLLDTLYDYVNGTLRDDLRFREQYSYPIYLPNEYTIFFNKIDKDQPEDLKNILISYPDSVIQVKQIFKEFIESNINDVDKINLIFDNNGFGIKFSRGEPTNMNIDSYVNIISGLSTVEEIDNFCRSNKEFNKICHNEELWRKLLKREYSFKYKKEYDYERLYKEIKFYKSYNINTNGLPNVISILEYNRMGELLRFLFGEKIIKPENYSDFLRFAVQVGDEGVINEIYEYYKSINRISTVISTTLEILDSDIKHNNIKGVRNFLKIVYPRIKDNILISDLDSVLTRERITAQRGLMKRRKVTSFSKEMYNTILSNYNPKDIMYLEKFIEFAATGAIYSHDIILLDELLNNGKLPEVIWAIRNYIRREQRLPDGDILGFTKSYMTPKQIEDLDNLTRLIF